MTPTTKALADELEARLCTIRQLELELTRLRQIAARVPAAVWIEAKEKAGYGELIHTMADTGRHR